VVVLIFTADLFRLNIEAQQLMRRGAAHRDQRQVHTTGLASDLAAADLTLTQWLPDSNELFALSLARRSNPVD